MCVLRIRVLVRDTLVLRETGKTKPRSVAPLQRQPSSWHTTAALQHAGASHDHFLNLTHLNKMKPSARW